MASIQSTDDTGDTEFTLTSIPKCPRDEHCKAVGTVLRSFVMSQVTSLDERRRRLLLIEFLNNKLRDIGLGYRVAVCRRSAIMLGPIDSEFHGRIVGDPPIPNEDQMQIVRAKMLEFFAKSKDFKICSQNGSTVCVKSNWTKGSRAKVVMHLGDKSDAAPRVRLYDEYAQQSPLVLPLILSFEQWMREQRVNVGRPLLEVAAIMTIFYLIKIKELNLIDQRRLASWTEKVDGGEEGASVLSLGFHWIRFLRFYAVEFDPLKEDIVICTTDSSSRGGIFIPDPLKPSVAIMARPDTPAFQNIILSVKKAYLYFAIPRSVPGSLYHRILPTDKASLCRSVVFHKFALPTDETNWKPLEPLTYIEWDPLVITEAVKGKKWREIEEIKGLDFESIRVRIFEKTGSGPTLRYVLEDDVNLLSGIFHPWFYKYEFKPRLDEPVLLKMESVRSPIMLPSASPILPPLIPAVQSVPPVPLVPIPLIFYPVNNGVGPSLTLLDNVINMNFDVDGMKEEDYIVRVEVLADLYKALQPLRYRLQTFGSSCNGFGRRFSDLDVYATSEAVLGEEDVKFTLLQIEKKLKLARHVFQRVQFIPAEVPVVKFVHVRRGVEGDISCNNQLAMRNTQLLRMYADIDPRVKILGVFLKTVTKITGINESVKGYLSSYAFIIMLIHYLQRTTPPVLPVLQELSRMFLKPVSIAGHDVTFFNDLPSLQFVWPYRFANKESVGQLWLGFLHYYLDVFNGKDHVITIRTLRPVLRTEKTWKQRKKSLFAIEDPFIMDKNLARSINSPKSDHIVEVFARLRQLCFEDCYHRLLTKQEFDFPIKSAVARKQEKKKLKEEAAATAKKSVSRKLSQRQRQKAPMATTTIAGKSVFRELSVEAKLSTLKI